MGINARVENERGRVVADVKDPQGYINWLLSIVNPEQSLCLRFIDPYGQTVFNGAQLIELQKELEMLRSHVTDEALQRSKQQYLESAEGWPLSARTEAGQIVMSLSREDLLDHVAKLLRLIREGLSRGPHYYVRFVGD